MPGLVRSAVVCGTLALPLILAARQPAAAQVGAGAASAVRDTFPLPRPVGLVNDFADLLTAAEEARVQALVQEVRAKSNGEIAVVTLAHLHGLSAAEAARRIGNGWGVGSAVSPGDPAHQTGVVLLVAPREREYRLEVAAGAAQFIADSTAEALLNAHMVPALRRSAYGEAIHETVRAVAERFARHFGFALEH